MKLIKAIMHNVIKKYTIMTLLITGMGFVTQMCAMTPERQKALDQKLIDAIYNNDIQQVEIELANGANPNTTLIPYNAHTHQNPLGTALGVYIWAFTPEKQSSAIKIIQKLVEWDAILDTPYWQTILSFSDPDSPSLLQRYSSETWKSNRSYQTRFLDIQLLAPLFIKAGGHVSPELVQSIKTHAPELGNVIEKALAERVERSRLVGEALTGRFNPIPLIDIIRNYEGLPVEAELPKPKRRRNKIMRFRDDYPQQAAEEREQAEQSSKPDDRSLLRLTPAPRTRTRTAINRTAQES